MIRLGFSKRRRRKRSHRAKPTSDCQCVDSNVPESNSNQTVQLPEFLEKRWEWPDFDPASCQECGCAIPLHEAAWLRDERAFCETCYVALEYQETARRQTAIELANKNAELPDALEFENEPGATSNDEGCSAPEIKEPNPQVAPPPVETVAPTDSQPSPEKATTTRQGNWANIRQQIEGRTDLHHVTIHAEASIESVQAAPVSDITPNAVCDSIPNPVSSPVSDVVHDSGPDVDIDTEITTEPTPGTAEHREPDLELSATPEQVEPAEHSHSTNEVDDDELAPLLEDSPILNDSATDSSDIQEREHHAPFTLALPQVSPIVIATSQISSEQNHDLDDAPSLPRDKPELANPTPDEKEPTPLCPAPEIADVPDESLEEVAELIATVNPVSSSEHTQTESDLWREEVHPLDAIPELEIETPLPIDEDARQRQAMLHQAAALRDHWFASSTNSK